MREYLAITMAIGTTLFTTQTVLAAKKVLPENVDDCECPHTHFTWRQVMPKILANKTEETTKDYNRVSKWLGLEDGQRLRGGGFGKTDTTDLMLHELRAIFEYSDGQPKPIAVLVSATNRIPYFALEKYFFRISLDGDLEKAVVVRMRYGERPGEYIESSWKGEQLGIDDPEVRLRFEHETNFWLKGMYRREKSGTDARVQIKTDATGGKNPSAQAAAGDPAPAGNPKPVP